MGKQRSQRSTTRKSKVNTQLELKSSATKKLDLTIEEVVDDMKLSLWRAIQGIKDEQPCLSTIKGRSKGAFS